jgi:hypothetical protein
VKMPTSPRRALVLPTLDDLESRRLLSGITPAYLQTHLVPLLDTTVSPLKKDDDDKGDDEDRGGDENENKGKGKGKGKSKKAPEITLLLAGQSLADNSATVDFGKTLQNAASPTKTFVIRNDGRKNLNIGGISLPAGFSLIDAPAGHVGKRKSTTFTVRLDSATVGAKSGVLSFSTNDADEKTFNFTIRGQVDAPTSPEFTLLINNNTANSGATLDFGQVTLGDAAPTRSFTLRNTGTAPLSINNLRVPEGFALVDGADASLAPGESDVVTLRLPTTAAGARNGTLTFSTNDGDEASISLNLTGRVNPRPANPPPPTPPPPPPPPASSARVAVSLVRPGVQALAIADGATTPINFGTVSVGARRPIHTFTVTNRGTSTLTLGRVELPPGFILAAKLESSLAPGQSDQFAVAMDTATPGARSGQIRFTTNDPRAPVLNFSIAGRVIEPVNPNPNPGPTPNTGGGATSSFVAGTLSIFGTAGNDVIILTGSGASVTATANGRTMSSTPFQGVTKIIVNAGGGDDRVSLAALSINGTLNGGPGNDTLEGSQADDVLNGGDGLDVLNGNNGRDNLLGGNADDSLTGGGGIDAFHGEAGNDTLNALDGLADALLDGGIGTDVIRRDRTDPAEI